MAKQLRILIHCLTFSCLFTNERRVEIYRYHMYDSYMSTSLVRDNLLFSQLRWEKRLSDWMEMWASMETNLLTTEKQLKKQREPSRQQKKKSAKGKRHQHKQNNIYIFLKEENMHVSKLKGIVIISSPKDKKQTNKKIYSNRHFKYTSKGCRLMKTTHWQSTGFPSGTRPPSRALAPAECHQGAVPFSLLLQKVVAAVTRTLPSKWWVSTQTETGAHPVWYR